MDNYHTISLNFSNRRIPITNFLVAGVDKKRRRRKRQTNAEGASPVGTTRNVEVVDDPVDQDYYPDEYFDFYRDGRESVHIDFWGSSLNPSWHPPGIPTFILKFEINKSG